MKDIDSQLYRIILSGPLDDVRNRIRDLSRDLEMQHLIVVKKYCDVLAHMGLAMCKAEQVLWYSPTQTVLQKIFSELCLDIEGDKEEQLQAFLNFIPGVNENGQKENKDEEKTWTP